jgi:hypothetical protein
MPRWASRGPHPGWAPLFLLASAPLAPARERGWGVRGGLTRGLKSFISEARSSEPPPAGRCSPQSSVQTPEARSGPHHLGNEAPDTLASLIPGPVADLWLPETRKHVRAVEFNDQFQRKATEIHDGITQQNLSTKLIVK